MSVPNFVSSWLTRRVRRASKPAEKPHPRPTNVRLSLQSLDERLLPSATQFPIPTANSQPEGIVRGPDGNLWFADIHAIGRITPSGQVTEFTKGLSSDSEPNFLTVGPDGNIWFTEGSSDKIGRITTAGVITEFPVISPGSDQVFVFGITAGRDGNLWFTEQAGAIGRITPTGVVTVFQTSGGFTQPSEPELITAGPDGNLWWADEAGFIGRITPAGVITRFSAGLSDPTPNSELFGITAGPDGNLWFTETSDNKIGRITTAGVITEFAGLTPNSLPRDIARGPDGNLWFTEFSANQIGRITPAGVISEFSAGISAGSAPEGITSGADGNLWFTEFDGNQIGRLLPPGPQSPQGGPTTTTLQASPTTAVFRQAETMKAFVTSQDGVPTGTVTFLDGTTVLGTAPVNVDGQAQLPVSLGVGNHTLTASFTGTNGFTNSVSTAVAEPVARAGTSVDVGSTLSTVVTGQTVTFTAVVSPVAPGGGTPTGTVTFKDGNSILGTVAVGANDTATFTTTFAAVGNHTITAVYSGSGNFLGSTSAAQTKTVLAPPTPPKVSSVVIYGGSIQRSEVTQIQVTFDQHVALPANPADAFLLVRQEDGALVAIHATVDDSGTGTVVTLTFTGGAVQGASLADGRYQLSVLAADVSNANGALDGTGAGVAGVDYHSPADTFGGGPSQLHLYRLFGDANGDGVVDATDVGQLKSTFNRNSTDPLYLSYLDANGDGVVDAIDIGQFKSRFDANIF
jgi:streptogramin lyase